MNKLIFGRYLPMNSWVHRLDPRDKLTLSFFFFILVFMANNWETYLLLSIVTLFSIWMSKIPWHFFFRGIRPLIWLIIFTVLLQLFFSPAGSHVYWQWGPFLITQFGIVNSAYVFMRFLLIIAMSTLLTLTTQPLDLANGIESLMAPLKIVHFPVETTAMMLSIALRFVPTLMDETETIMNAQRARGVDFGSGSIMKQIKTVIPLLVPLFVSAFNHAEDLSVAMEARGYQPDTPRTHYRQLVWHRQDTISWGFYIVVFIGLLALRQLP
ncbi:energy-coupling factor transporter transmembrane component T family protein [Levilactobacillus bambusae]|uniref:Energy-coupling factor transporter transmembrane protein EcfT n=1 Tax=Levilactobacillus bambusae TaxID=2024736 RepID=A0A2V1MYW1_9LACO|nr:energy-coupling factor transporter transmembrane component T [Levilactobacillus bambusae]PWF99952.1 cobalt ABC transporter ATP-binding protein [Levilactobacillus bambusae]